MTIDASRIVTLCLVIAGRHTCDLSQNVLLVRFQWIDMRMVATAITVAFPLEVEDIAKLHLFDSL